MARTAEGWKLREQGGYYYVRFRHQGRRHTLATGTRDPGEAARKAPGLYAEALARLAAGQGATRRLSAPATTSPLDELLALWLASLEGPAGLAKGTRAIYEVYTTAHWLTRWDRLGQLTAAALKKYVRERLGKVTRKSVRKELSALRGFLAWCADDDQALLPVAPVVTLPERKKGTRAVRRRDPVPLSAGEVRALLAQLPEEAPRARREGQVRGGERYPVRAYCELLWETGLRPKTIEALSVPTHWRPGAAALDLEDADDKVQWGRSVPLSLRACELLAEHAPASGAIFGRYRIEAYLRAAARAAGIESARARLVKAYDLRHARLTALADAGAARSAIQYLAGHTQASTTERYLHPLGGGAAAALALLEATTPATCAAAPRRCRFGAAIGAACSGGGPLAVEPVRPGCSPFRL